MNLEGGKISSSQLMFLIIGYTIGSSVILSPGSFAGKDAWLAIIAGFIEGLVFVSIQLALMLRFPGKNLIEITEIIFGHFVGKVISVIYLWFFLHLAALVLRNFSDFFTSIIYPNTPLVVIGFSLILFCLYAVSGGVEVIARCSIVFVILFILTITLNILLTIKEMNPSHLFPILDIPIEKFLKASHGVSTFPFAEFFAFSMVIPRTNKYQEIKPSVLKALAIACLLLTMANIRDIMVLGPLSTIATYSTYSAVRTINIANIITRVEILIAINLIGMGFIKISVLFYGAALGAAQLFKLRSYLPLVYPFASLILALSIFASDNFIDSTLYAINIWPHYSLPINVGLPLVSLIVAFIRKLPHKEAPVNEA